MPLLTREVAGSSRAPSSHRSGPASVSGRADQPFTPDSRASADAASSPTRCCGSAVITQSVSAGGIPRNALASRISVTMIWNSTSGPPPKPRPGLVTF